MAKQEKNGNHHGQPKANSQANQESKRRTKLQKKRKEIIPLYSCSAVLEEVIRSSILFSVNDDGGTALTGVDTSCRVSNQPQNILLHHFLKTQPLIAKLSVHSTIKSIDSLSNYPDDDDDKMEKELGRRRAKTPCLWIGHLEESKRIEPFDPTKLLANEYQDILPPRSFTPYSEVSHLRPKKALRKVKGQQSLRDLVSCHRLSFSSTSSSDKTSGSDTETLVGTPTSQISPLSEHFPDLVKPKQFDEQPCRDIPSPIKDHDIGFQICLELLTNELATALFKQHPAGGLEKASRLQILLMIEAYEAIQQRIRQDSSIPKHTETMLDNWLAALYAIHDGDDSSRSSSFHSSRSSFTPPAASPVLAVRSSKKASTKGSEDFLDFHFDFEDDQELRAWGARDVRPT